MGIIDNIIAKCKCINNIVAVNVLVNNKKLFVMHSWRRTPILERLAFIYRSFKEHFLFCLARYCRQFIVFSNTCWRQNIRRVSYPGRLLDVVVRKYIWTTISGITRLSGVIGCYRALGPDRPMRFLKYSLSCQLLKGQNFSPVPFSVCFHLCAVIRFQSRTRTFWHVCAYRLH